MRPGRDHPVDVRTFIHAGSGGGRRQLLVEAGIARAIIRDAAGGVELDGLERTKERPAQAETILDGVIEVFRRDITLADEAKSFSEQRALQAVQHKAVDLAVDGHRHLPDLAIDRAGAVDRLGRGPGRAAQFDQWHQMRRIDGVTDQAARPAGQVFREARGGDGRGGGHQERILRRQPVELGKDDLLFLDLLGPVFLDEFDAADGLLEVGGNRDPCDGAIGIAGQAMARQRVQLIADQARRRL